MIGLVIPVAGPLVELHDDPDLDKLQQLVGGDIEAVPLPPFLGDAADHSTAYINDAGKDVEPPNMRATDFFVPGIGLFMGDYIAGPLVLLGFDPESGGHERLPKKVIDRARLIEREAGA